MRSSLIIATYNWERALDLVLASVHAQRVLPDEVLIADDGSGPATRAVIERWQDRFQVPLRHVWQEDHGFRLAASRNRALGAATGDYVISIDGDMVLHSRFVESHLRFARPGTYVQGGRVKIREGLTKRILDGEPVKLGFWTRQLGIRSHAIHLPILSPLYRGRLGPLLDTMGCNMAFWMTDVRRVNGFNEDIEGWGYEDIEFAARMQQAGVQRRNLKFGGVAFHLHHGGRPENQHLNREFLDRVAREGITRCRNGLDKYLESATADARAND